VGVAGSCREVFGGSMRGKGWEENEIRLCSNGVKGIGSNVRISRLESMYQRF
jgi:hypothetical protein